MYLANISIKIRSVKSVNATSLWYYTPNLCTLTVASVFLVIIQLGLAEEWEVLSTMQFQLLVTFISKSQAALPFNA